MIGKLEWSGDPNNPDWIRAEEFNEFTLALYLKMWGRENTGLPLPKARWRWWHPIAFRQHWEYGLNSDTPFHMIEGNGFICIEGEKCGWNHEINYIGFGMMAAAADTDFDDMLDYVEKYNISKYGEYNTAKGTWSAIGYEFYEEYDTWVGPQLEHNQ
jgi:hypothetical protein